MLGKESGPKQFVRTKESTAAKELQEYKDQATAPWRAQMAEDAQYNEFDPLVHQAVPPSKIRIIKDADNKLQAIIKARTAGTGATTFDDTGVTQFAMEGISEKDISPAKPVRPVPLGVPDTGPSAILKDQTKTPDTSDIAPKVAPVLGTPKERAAAFEKASPDRPPSERVKARKLQETAKFQSEKTVFDVAEDVTSLIKSMFDPQDVEAVEDIMKGYVTHEEPFLSRKRYKGRIRKFSDQLKEGTLSSKRKVNLKKLENFITSNVNKAFSQEIATLGISIPEITKRLRMIYMGETNLGTNVKSSSTGAIGHLQVLPSTFKSVIKQGQFGPKAAKIVNLDIKKIRKADNDKLKELLKIPEVNFMVAIAKVLQYLKTKKGN